MREEKRVRRKERRDKGRVMVTQRDLTVLSWIGEQYALRLDHLQILLGKDAQRETLEEGRVSEKTAARVVERWRKLGLITTQKFFYKEPSWVWLSREGLRQLRLSYRFWEPKLGSLEHLHWVNHVRLFVEKQWEGRTTWISERALRQETRGKTPHVADAALRYNESLIGVEVELTRKKQHTLLKIMERLSREYQSVWYFVRTDTKPLVERTLAGLHEDGQRQFRVYLLEDLEL